jgi:hypothetical protein
VGGWSTSVRKQIKKESWWVTPSLSQFPSPSRLLAQNNPHMLINFGHLVGVQSVTDAVIGGWEHVPRMAPHVEKRGFNYKIPTDIRRRRSSALPA